MSRVCAFCSTGRGAFTCPRCNKDYCGLKCYQSVNHTRCSEDFYKECVKAELVGDNLSEESKARMQQILLRMTADDGSDAAEDDDVDSDDDEDVADLSERLVGVDLEDSDKVWGLLSERERREFNELLEKGNLESLLPNFSPWWSLKVEEPKIQELDAPVNLDFKENCPSVWENIPKFSQLFGGKPSDFIKYGVLNLLYSYAYAVRFLYGDYEGSCQEFVSIVETLAGESGSLAGVNFSLADTAVEAAASAVNLHPHLGISLEFSRSVKKDVYQIVQGPSPAHRQFYLLASLSDLRTQYQKAYRALKKPAGSPVQKPPSRFTERAPELDPRKVKVHLKKIEFYLSWAQDHHKEYREL